MIVTMDIWRVRRWAIPIALLYMAWHRRIRRLPGARFVKLLGTGTGRTFTPRDADAQQWAILGVWESQDSADAFRDGPFARAWQRISSEYAALNLMPIASHGQWSGQTPFTPTRRPSHLADSRVVAVTRARIAWRRTRRFWSAVPPVTAALHDAPGLLAAIGIGEAPLGLQGTFSLWESDQALKDFAYRDHPHAKVVERTRSEQWYSEELFARFAVLSARGVLRGQSVESHP